MIWVALRDIIGDPPHVHKGDRVRGTHPYVEKYPHLFGEGWKSDDELELQQQQLAWLETHQDLIVDEQAGRVVTQVANEPPIPC